VLGIVENMSQFVCPHATPPRPSSTTGAGGAPRALPVPFLGEIPLELRVRVGGDEGRPVVAAHPDSAEAEAFMVVARAVAGRVSVVNGARAPAAPVPAAS
jgi:ATP-binding protein involved in chromosome partitioning